MLNIKGKRILFIGIGFYDYEQNTKMALENNGAIVNYVKSTVNLLFSRILSRLGLNKYAKSLNNKTRYNLLKKTANDYDIIFTIKGEDLNQEDLKLLKEKNPNALWKLYLWDSIVRHYNLDILFKYFDNVWSFDRLDCTRNPNLKFRPLFYRSKQQMEIDRKYTLSFVGWMHSDRLALARQIRDELLKRRELYFIKLFISPFSYFVERYVTRTISKVDDELITTKAIDYEQYLEVTRDSRIILDIAHPLQSGLTMRSIEALAEGCHLLTTNSDIMYYEDIPASKYSILERGVIKDVVPTQYDNKAIVIGNYSIDKFIEDIFA